MKLKEIAQRIDAHLKRFEADPKINKWHGGERGSTTPYYNAGACQAGRWMQVRYISYQGVSNLKREDAIAYLAWLDAGNVGKHWRR